MSWSWLGSDDADENDEGNADQNEMVVSLVMCAIYSWLL